MNLKQFLFANNSSHQILAKNTFWLGLIEVFSKLIMFFVTISIGLYLGTNGFGAYNYALSFVSLFMIFSDLGVSTVITRDIAKHKDKAADYLGNSLSLRLITSLFIIIVMSISLTLFKSYHPYSGLIVLVTIFYLCQQISGLTITVLTAFEKMEFVFISKLIYFVGILFSTIFMVKSNGGINLMIILNTGISVITIITGFYLIRQLQIPVLLCWQKNFIRQVLRESIPIFGFIACTQIYLNLDTLLIGRYFGDHSVGIYQAAYKILFAFQSVNIINSATLPRISVLIHENKHSTLAKLNRLVIILSLVVLLPLAIIISLNSRLIISLVWRSPDYLAASFILPLLIWSGIANYFRNYVTNLLIASSRQKYVFISILIGLVVNSALNLFIMPLIGYPFAATSLLISEVVILLSSIIFIRL